MLVGCASPPMVELPTPLPTNIIANSKVLPQSYRLTPEDRARLMKDVSASSSKIDASVNPYWMESWETLSLLNHTQKVLVEKMQETSTLQEFNKYKKLFLECKYLHSLIMDDSAQIKERIQSIREEF